MRRLACLPLVALLIACVTPAPAPLPPQPAPAWDLDVQVAGEGLTVAQVEITDGPNAGTKAATDATGRVLLPRLQQAGFTVCAAAAGFQRACTGITLTHSQNVTIRLARVVVVPPPPSRPPTMRGRLTARGRQLVYPDGAVFVWRGATSFALLDLLADGKEAEAIARLREYRDLGFSLVRVLAQADGLFKLSPASGRAKLARLCTLVTEHDLYAEIVALADSAALQTDGAAIRSQVRAVGLAAAACPAFVVQVANEHAHSTQHPLVRDTVFLTSLATEIPEPVLYTLAPPFDDEKLTPTGEYVTRHRSRSRDEWNQVRRVRELEMVSNSTKRFVVDDEPIGADEQDRAGARESNCSIFFTQGVLARLFEVGSTFHSQDGLFSKPWRKNQRACAEAFIAGTRIVPDAQRLRYENAGWATSPVKDAHFSDRPGGTVVRVYSGVSGSTGITVALGLTGDPRIVWQNGWRPVKVINERAGVTVWEIAK